MPQRYRVVEVVNLRLGSEIHRRFAELTASIGKHFHLLGIVAQLGGLTLIYLGGT